MNSADVKRSLHIEEVKQQFKECTDPPYDHLTQQDGLSVINDLSFVLNYGIPTLLHRFLNLIILQGVNKELIKNYFFLSFFL